MRANWIIAQSQLIDFSLPFCATESLKLQRNTENYHFLRYNHSNASAWQQSDKAEFTNTKVNYKFHEIDRLIIGFFFL